MMILLPCQEAREVWWAWSFWRGESLSKTSLTANCWTGDTGPRITSMVPRYGMRVCEELEVVLRNGLIGAVSNSLQVLRSRGDFLFFGSIVNRVQVSHTSTCLFPQHAVSRLSPQSPKCLRIHLSSPSRHNDGTLAFEIVPMNGFVLRTCQHEYVAIKSMF